MGQSGRIGQIREADGSAEAPQGFRNLTGAPEVSRPVRFRRDATIPRWARFINGLIGNELKPRCTAHPDQISVKDALS
jgi:hypothetical protein